MVVQGGRQYILDGFAKWTNLGKFTSGTEEHRELQEIAACALIRTQATQESDESAFTWPRT